MVMAWVAVERMMKLQEVICPALAGTLSWLQAADVPGMQPRSLRRWRARYETGGKLALYARRHGPSPRKAPAPEVERVSRLYRQRYGCWYVRHFHRFAHREHRVTLSYRFVKLVLQDVGLLRIGRALELLSRGHRLIILGDFDDYDGNPASQDHVNSTPITNVLRMLKAIDPAMPADDLTNALSLVPKAKRFTAFHDANQNGQVNPPRSWLTPQQQQIAIIEQETTSQTV